MRRLAVVAAALGALVFAGVSAAAYPSSLASAATFGFVTG